jgi:hypothetical protein
MKVIYWQKYYVHGICVCVWNYDRVFYLSVTILRRLQAI